MHFLLALTLSETKKNKCSAKCKMCKIDFVVDISPTQGPGNREIKQLRLQPQLSGGLFFSRQ